MVENGQGVLLSTRRLCKSFGGVRAVVDFDLVLRSRHVVGLIGPNGAGKTTIFNLILGITRADSGQVDFCGREITRDKPCAIARLGIGRTFQNVRLFDGLSVIDNVKAAFHHEITYSVPAALFGLPLMHRQEAAIEQRAMEILDLVGLSHCCGERPRNLPYGLQRRVEIARALATGPRVLLLDEPAAGLNPSEVAEMVQLIGQLHTEWRLSILLIEHHMEVVMPICHDIYVLNFGRSIAHGTPAEVQRDPQVLKAYLGEEDTACS